MSPNGEEHPAFDGSGPGLAPNEPSAGQTPWPIEIEEYLTWLAAVRGRAATTVAAYRRDLHAYVRYLHHHELSVATATASDIAAFAAYLRQIDLAPATQARRLVAVRQFHRFLLEEDLAAHDPGHEVELPPVPRGVPRALSEAEIEKLLATVVGDDAVARRDRAILEVLYGTGVRISELVGLSLQDIDPMAGRMRVFGKGSKERVVPIGRHAGLALEAWLGPGGRDQLEPERWRRRGDSEAVFLNARGGRLSRQGAWGVVRKYGDRAGIGNRLTPHVLRHSCATHMIDHGADLRVVQELLGHSSVSTTQVYTLVSNERLWAVYTSAHPRAGGSRSPR